VIETAMGPLRMALFYLIVMFGSNIFGAVCSPMYAIGSDPIIFGFIASLYTLVLVYWNRVGGTSCIKVCCII
jgi:membrane associated rhomboid family serine protease